ncbi:MAG: hypothetical protein PHY93_20720 [Bacteriovorax sp.]|nr:hypothetical protein [Bacteriovorax sp.]
MYRYLLIFIISTDAWSFQIIRNKSQLLLQARTCDEVIDLRKSLAEWSIESSDHKVCPKNKTPVEDKKKQFCNVDITQCVPDHVIKYNGINPKNAGPNCWNLALVIKEILPGLRSSTPEELSFYMKPPLCRELDSNEERRVGDIGNIKTFDIIEKNMPIDSHAFLYISDKIVYSKNGESSKSPYVLQSYDDVLNVYGISKGEKCRTKKTPSLSDCGSTISFFRCISITEYLKNSPEVLSPILNTFKDIQNFEKCSIEKLAINAEPINKQQMYNIIDSISVLTAFLNNEKVNLPKDKELDEKAAFILGSIQLRLKAINKQLSTTTYQPGTDTFESLSWRFDAAIKSLKK